MAYKTYWLVLASVSATLALLSTDVLAQAKAAQPGAMLSLASTARPVARPLAARPFRHHSRNNIPGFWPAVGDTVYNAPNGQAVPAYPPQTSADVHYTYTYDVPWDWAHRYPPNVAPSDRAYVPSCSVAPVIVPGRSGQGHAVNITRCY
jgi:hypothetical protein